MGVRAAGGRGSGEAGRGLNVRSLAVCLSSREMLIFSFLLSLLQARGVVGELRGCWLLPVSFQPDFSQVHSNWTYFYFLFVFVFIFSILLGLIYKSDLSNAKPCAGLDHSFSQRQT